MLQIAMPENQSSNNRMYWVDNAKGIGILLVLLGHTPLPVEYKLFIYAFHMPLFFFLAGLFLNMEKPLSTFVKEKMHRLLVPYIFFAVLSYMIWFGTRHYSALASSIPSEVPLFGIFYGVGSGNWMTENIPLWFLPCLFATICLLYLLSHLPYKLSLTAILACSVIGYNLPRWINFRLPFSFDLALICVVFAGLGYHYRKYWLTALPLSWPETAGYTVVWLLAAWFNTGILNPIQMIDINNSVFGNYFLFLIAAVSGTVITVNLAKRLLNFPALTYVGKNSISIICLHMLIYLVVTVIFSRVFHFPLTLTYESLSVINPHAHPGIAILSYMIPGVLIPLWFMSIYRTCKTSLFNIGRRLKFREQRIPINANNTVRTTEPDKQLV